MRVRLYVSTNKVGSKCEDIIDIPDDEVEGMTEKELDEHLNSYAEDHKNNIVNWGFEIIDK
ncbi:unnamed protein product [marine sediment metagenome]|uniref:DUF7167 domain-containing protein n=1 Tax=marine sediment metagenome TaxID=412755 RepID=X1A0Q0_9ZZZZ